MSVELQFLGWAILLGLFHFAPKLILYKGTFLVWATGPRDKPMPELPLVLGRVERATRNFLETFPYFAAAVLATQAMNIHNDLTLWGVHLYFWGRAAYLPLYAAGIPWVRSLSWNTATFGIVLIVIPML